MTDFVDGFLDEQARRNALLSQNDINLPVADLQNIPQASQPPEALGLVESIAVPPRGATSTPHHYDDDDYTLAVLADSPVALWRLNERAPNFGGIPGQFLTDSSLNGRNGTYSASGVTLLSRGPRRGPADSLGYLFDGLAGIATVPDNAAFSFGTGSFSVEAWISILVGGPTTRRGVRRRMATSPPASVGHGVVVPRLPTRGAPWRFRGDDGAAALAVVAAAQGAGTSRYPFWKGSDPTVGAGYSIRVDGANQVQVFISDGVSTYSTGTSRKIGDAAWHHVVLVCDRSANRLRQYLDGVEQTPALDITAAGSVTNANAVQVGRGGAGSWFSGAVAEVAAYGSALPAARVLAHYNVFGQAAVYPNTTYGFASYA